MEKPIVYDSDLHKIVEKLYRLNAEIGSGSTAAALRHEVITRQPTRGRWHLEKTEETISFLEKWLKQQDNVKQMYNSNYQKSVLEGKTLSNQYVPASNNDIAAAENLLIDLRESMIFAKKNNLQETIKEWKENQKK